MQYLLVNPHSGHGDSSAKAQAYLAEHPDGARLFDLTEVADIRTLLAELTPDDQAVIFGGDGTLNRLINDVPDLGERYTVLYYPSGTGNDFCLDIGRTAEEAPFSVNEYLKALPTVTVNGKSYRFINGVGFGIDGYCCEIGDKCRAKGEKANYTAIAIKGLLFFFKPRNATVTVDSGIDALKSNNYEPGFGYIYIASGTFDLTAENDGIQAEQRMLIDGGEFHIEAGDGYT